MFSTLARAEAFLLILQLWIGSDDMPNYVIALTSSFCVLYSYVCHVTVIQDNRLTAVT